VKTGYFIETWDTDLQKWTPQFGVPRGPWSEAGLINHAIPALESIGYSVGFDRATGDAEDPYVMIEIDRELADDVRLRQRLPWNCRLLLYGEKPKIATA
jgi:hypothetical protein